MSAFKITRILCPTDFSPNADAALDAAAVLSERFDAAILLLHVWTPPVVVAFDAALIASPEDIAALTESLQKSLDQTMERIPRPRRFVHKHLVQGNDWHEIVEFAGREHCDLIVMGTHGRTGLSHVMLGSVAEKVVRSARLPVLTIPFKRG